MKKKNSIAILASLAVACAALLGIQRDSQSQTVVVAEKQENAEVTALLDPLKSNWKAYHQKMKTIDISWTIKPKNGLRLEDYLGAPEAKTSTTNWLERTRFVLDGKKFRCETWDAAAIPTATAQSTSVYDGKKYQDMSDTLTLSERTELPQHVPYKRQPPFMEIFNFALQGKARELATAEVFQSEATWTSLNKIVGDLKKVQNEGRDGIAVFIDDAKEPLRFAVWADAKNELPARWESTNKATGEVVSTGRIETFTTVGADKNAVTLPTKWSYELRFKDKVQEFEGAVDLQTLRVNQAVEPQLFGFSPSQAQWIVDPTGVALKNPAYKPTKN